MLPSYTHQKSVHMCEYKHTIPPPHTHKRARADTYIQSQSWMCIDFYWQIIGRIISPIDNSFCLNQFNKCYQFASLSSAYQQIFLCFVISVIRTPTPSPEIIQLFCLFKRICQYSPYWDLNAYTAGYACDCFRVSVVFCIKACVEIYIAVHTECDCSR